jgi:hypothetical protein
MQNGCPKNMGFATEFHADLSRRTIGESPLRACCSQQDWKVEARMPDIDAGNRRFMAE